MVIDLQRAVNFKCQKKLKFHNLSKGFCKSSFSKITIFNYLIENAITAKHSTFGSTQKNIPFFACDLLKTQLKHELTLSGLGKTKGLKETNKEKTDEVLQALKIVINNTCRCLTFTKLFFPHRCKKIFVHFSEKTNLLFRSENKTEFSAGKILQTTTI